MTVEKLIEQLSQFPKQWHVRGDVFSTITKAQKCDYGNRVVLLTSDVI